MGGDHFLVPNFNCVKFRSTANGEIYKPKTPWQQQTFSSNQIPSSEMSPFFEFLFNHCVFHNVFLKLTQKSNFLLATAIQSSSMCLSLSGSYEQF